MSVPNSFLAENRVGLTHAIAAYLLWGMLPLYFLLLKGVDAIEVVADRILFSLILMVGVMAVMKRWGQLGRVIRSPRTLGFLVLSAVLISINWLVYVWAVQHHHVLEASLGYFLNPLINVLLGVVVLRERLSRVQVAAVALAGAGVAVLASGAGAYLWISLTLGLSFGIYGLVRKMIPVETLEGLTIETALLAPIALGYLIISSGRGELALGSTTELTLLLALGGVVTAVPLLLFGSAARRLPYSLVGLLQYIAPTIQFALAITVFGEAMTLAHAICFGLIWAGLAVFVLGSMRKAPERVATG